MEKESLNGSYTSEECISDKSLLKALQDKAQLVDNTALQNEIQMALSSLAGHVQNTVDVWTLKEVRSCVTAAINLIRAHQDHSKPFHKSRASY